MHAISTAFDTALDTAFQTLDGSQLAETAGGFDVGRVVAAGNANIAPGATAGAAIGGVGGAIAGRFAGGTVAGAPTMGLGTVGGILAGAVAGGTAGSTAGGAIGGVWAGSAAPRTARGRSCTGADRSSSARLPREHIRDRASGPTRRTAPPARPSSAPAILDRGPSLASALAAAARRTVITTRSRHTMGQALRRVRRDRA